VSANHEPTWAKKRAKAVLYPTSAYRCFVGIDWGSATHHACVLDLEANIVEERRVRHTASDVAEFFDYILGLTPDASTSMAVAIKVPHGTLVEELLERRLCVFSINPKQLDRFGDRYLPAGAKDDGRDAFVLADSLRTDQHCFRQVRPGDSFARADAARRGTQLLFSTPLLTAASAVPSLLSAHSRTFQNGRRAVDVGSPGTGAVARQGSQTDSQTH